MRYLLSVLILTSACTPSQNIIMKEKVVERNAAPRPSLQVDHFLYGQAHGNVDVLFVVDNTESGEVFLESFKTSYVNFINLFPKDVSRNLNYRVQVVSTPNGRAPKNFASNENKPDLQLRELYGPPLDDSPKADPILQHQERGALTPVESTVSGFSNAAFAGHDGAATFIVYLLGYEAEIYSTSGLEKAKDFYQTHAFLIGRKSDDLSPMYPHCDSLEKIEKTETAFRDMPWRTLTSMDLCDPNWVTFPDQLMKAIVEFKSKIILSHNPTEPETMFVKGPTRTYRYGEDYTFDMKNNEIVFVLERAPAIGDLLEVSYFLKSNDPTLGGSSTPPGNPKK